MCVFLGSKENIANCDMTGFGKASLERPLCWGFHALYPLHFHPAAVETQPLVVDGGWYQNKDLCPGVDDTPTLALQTLNLLLNKESQDYPRSVSRLSSLLVSETPLLGITEVIIYWNKWKWMLGLYTFSVYTCFLNCKAIYSNIILISPLWYFKGTSDSPCQNLY